MACITQTTPPITHFTLALAKSQQTLVASADHRSRLLEIFSKYQSWSDLLSKRLRTWITLTQYDAERGDIQQLAHRLDVLVYDILRDPITRRPFENPILQQGYTWEKNTFDFYRDHVSCISPLDGVSELSAPEGTHDFAIEMLSLVASAMPTPKSKPDILLEEDSSQEKMPLSCEESDQWKHLAKVSYALQQAKYMEEMLESSREKGKHVVEEAFFFGDQAIEMADRLIFEHQKAMEVEMASIEAAYQTQVLTLQSQIEQEACSHEQSMRDMEEKLKQAEERGQKELSHLFNQIEEAKSKYTQKILLLKTSLENAKKALERSKTETKNNHLQRISQIKEISQQIQMADSRIADLQQKLKDLRTQPSCEAQIIDLEERKSHLQAEKALLTSILEKKDRTTPALALGGIGLAVGGPVLGAVGFVIGNVVGGCVIQ